MRQDTSQVSKEALVDGKNTLCADSLEQAVKDALVQITGLVVHASHDSVYKTELARSDLSLMIIAHTRRVHEAAHHKSRSSTTGQVQSRSFLHAKVPGQAALGKEVCGELDGTAKTRTDHSSAHTTVHALDAFTPVNLAQTVKRIFIVVLGTDWEEGRVGLQARLDQEEWRTSRSTDDTGGGTGEDVGSERLNFWIAIDGRCEVGADRLIEAKTTAVEQDLVDVLRFPQELAQFTLMNVIAFSHTADPIPRNRPRGPSFCRITLTPCRTPRYFFTPSFFACSSPCSCNLQACQHWLAAGKVSDSPNLNGLETVSNGHCTTGRNASSNECSIAAQERLVNSAHEHGFLATPYPVVVDMTPNLRAECAAGVRCADSSEIGVESECAWRR